MTFLEKIQKELDNPEQKAYGQHVLVDRKALETLVYHFISFDNQLRKIDEEKRKKHNG